MWKETLKEQGLGFEEGCLKLKEYQTYYLRIPCEELEQFNEVQGFIHQIGDYGIYALNIGSCLGYFTIGDLKVKVVSHKLSDDQFATLLSEVSAYTAGLPFSYKGGKGSYVKTSDYADPVLYHVFNYLSGLVESGLVKSAVEIILNNPHFIYFKETELYPVEMARRAGPATFRSLVQEPRHLVQTPESSRIYNTGLSRNLFGHFPQRVRLSRLKYTLDNPENQFIKYFLMLSRRIAEQAKEVFKNEIQLTEKAQEIACYFDRLLKMPFFYELSPLQNIPFSSQVLQKKRGYRELFSVFNRLNLIIDHLPLSKWQNMIEMKDAALLYEYWTFISIARILEDILGKPLMAGSEEREQKEVLLPHSLKIVYPDGITLWYNRSYSGSNRGSYSVTLRPDVVLEMNNISYVFDAKFKVENIDTEELFNPEETSGGGSNTFKKQDVHKMHTYRDAIDGCLGAFAVYPGSNTKLFSLNSEKPFRGVGAVSLMPQRVNKDLENLIHSLTCSFIA